MNNIKNKAKNFEIRVDSKDWKEALHLDYEASDIQDALSALGGFIIDESSNNRELFIRLRIGK